jgi:hypothetical protein
MASRLTSKYSRGSMFSQRPGARSHPIAQSPRMLPLAQDRRSLLEDLVKLLSCCSRSSLTPKAHQQVHRNDQNLTPRRTDRRAQVALRSSKPHVRYRTGQMRDHKHSRLSNPTSETAKGDGQTSARRAALISTKPSRQLELTGFVRGEKVCWSWGPNVDFLRSEASVH